MRGGVREVLERALKVLEHFNTWPEQVLTRFNSVLTPPLEQCRTVQQWFKMFLLSNLKWISSIYELFQLD